MRERAAKERPSSLGPRLIIGIVGAALAVAGMLTLHSDYVFGVVFVMFTWASVEFVRIVERIAPSAPLRLLWLWIPLSQILGFLALRDDAGSVSPLLLFAAFFGLVAVASLSCLLSSADMRDGTVGMGLVAFAVPYFTLGSLGCYRAHQVGEWWLFLLLAIVALGDTFAFFIGRSFGKHKLAPKVSPKKTWEGSTGGFAASLVATAVWSFLRLGEVSLPLLGVAAVTAIVAQMGDLVESVVKRAGGVKDSSHVLPGHGGFYDRLDAMMLAAPAFVVGLWLTGLDA